MASRLLIKRNLEDILENLHDCSADTYKWNVGREVALTCLEDLAACGAPYARVNKAGTLTALVADPEAALVAGQARLAFDETQTLLRAHRSQDLPLAVASAERAFGHVESW